MKILIISNYYPPLELGGWEQLTRDVAEHLQKRGHHVYVLTSKYRATEAKPEPNVARVLHLVSPDHNHYHPHYALSAGWRQRANRRLLFQAIQDFSPDILFINGMWNLSPDLAWYAEHLLSHRVVYYIASSWPTDPRPDEIFWRSPAAHRWLGNAKAVLGALAYRVLPRDLRRQLRFDHVLCVSEFMRHYMIEQVGVPSQNTHVVYNGIDIAHFPMRDLKMHRDMLQLLYAGGLLQHKGVHTAIQAINILVHQKEIHAVHLTLVGDGHPDYVNQLQKLVCDLSINSYVTFYGRVPRTEIPNVIRQFDVLLFPSVNPEALPRIVQEAMACGLVVIGTIIGGTSEILRNGENGLVFEAGNPESLADKIEQILMSPDTCVRLAINARKTIEQNFSLERMVDQLETHFAKYKL